MDYRLYVGNLAKETTQDELSVLFAQAGEVVSVNLITDRKSGLSKGYAFVNMTTQADAEKAISMFNAFSLAESELKVDLVKPRNEH